MTDAKIIQYLTDIRQGNHQAIINPDEFTGPDKELATEIRSTISELIRENVWYQGILDAIPFPMSVTDMDMNWTFINRSTEKMLNVKRSEIRGKHCSNWGANICNTENCGIEQLRKGRTSSIFEQGGGHFRTDVAYIETEEGKRLGHVEIVTDITEIAKVNLYLKEEIAHLAKNMEKLAQGELDLNFTVTPADDHTREVSELFVQMNISLKKAVSAISLMTSDTLTLAKAALNGALDTRTDATKHEGDYRKIVQGVNDTLDSVVTPIREALRVSKEYADSNFTARFDPGLAVAGDWIEFKEALDNIGIQISTAVRLINRQLMDLAANAEEATASIEEVTAGAQQIARNAGEVSSNSLRGEDGIIQVLKAMEDLNITVAEVSRRAELVSSSATQANAYAQSGVQLAQQSETAMEEIKRSSTEVDLIVKEINQQMEEIGKIVRLITDISNQTNLLALNAAIEAARAGEAGRGFAVVAAEVKSLAQDSRKSAENISDMILNLQTKAKKANDAMGLAGKAVEEGGATLTETVDSFNQIAGSIDDITRNATDVASSSEEQAASVEEVTASINEVSDLVQNTAKEAGDAAAATEEASASIEQISKIVANVNDIVTVVTSEMAKFRI